MRSPTGLMILACLGFAAAAAHAQDLSPRAYVVLPTDSNALVVGYSHLSGSLELDGSLPITDAQAQVNLGILSFYHSFSFFGRSASVDVVLPYGWGNFNGTVAQVPRSAERSGFLDSTLRLSVNLLGGPAMTPAEFARWRQDVLLGFSVTISAPSGEYDADRLVNFGANRWGVKSELGYSQRFGAWVLDGYAGAWFFSKNTAFYPGMQSQTEAPVGEVEAHLSYDLHPRLWISLDANYWWGGATSVNGVQNSLTDQRNSRIGVTASLPLTKHQSLKFSVSDGAYIRYGGDYRSVSLAWQYGWIGRPARP
jgi:hypothetical protein